MVSVMIPLTSRKTGPVVSGGSDPPTVPLLLLTSFPSPSLTAHSAFLVLLLAWPQEVFLGFFCPVKSGPYLVTSPWTDGAATGSLAVWANVYVSGLSSVHVSQKSSCSFCSGLDSFLRTMKLLCHPVFTCSQVSLTDRASVLLSGASQKMIQDHVIAPCSCPGVVAPPPSLGVQSGRKRAVHLPPSFSSVEPLFF